MGGCVLGVDMLAWATTMLALQRPPADCRRRRRRLAGDLAATDRRDAAVRRGLARPPAARRLLEARLDRRVLRRGRVSAADGRRLGRRLPQRRPAGSRAATHGPRLGLIGPWSHHIPVRRTAGPVDRIPPGMPALVRPLAQGTRDRDHGRAAPARLDAGIRASRCAQRGSPGPLGGRDGMAAQRAEPRVVLARSRMSARRAAPRG